MTMREVEAFQKVHSEVDELYSQQRECVLALSFIFTVFVSMTKRIQIYSSKKRGYKSEINY